MSPRYLALAVAAVCAAATAAPAQEPGQNGVALSTLQGAFTEAQARKGEEVYRRYCIECHTPAAYVGAAFRNAWTGRTVFDLFELIRTTMPNDRPGKLGRGQYAEIVAYLLHLNGLPAGEKKLPSNEDGLKQIRIDTSLPNATPPRGETPPP